MPTSPPSPTTGSAYAAQPVTKVPDWHGLVAWDVFLNGLTTGLFLTAALGELFEPSAFAPLAKVAHPLALVLLLLDLACLVLDLGDPQRFHHMLRVFKPSSPMSLGVWSLNVYAAFATLAAALSLLPAGGEGLAWTRRGVLILGMVPALASAVYKGVLFSTSSQPGWKDARWLGGFLTSSALVLGCAETLLLAVVLGQEKAAAMLRPGLLVLLLVNAAPLCLLSVELWPALALAYSPQKLLGLAAAIFIGGIVVPATLLLIPPSPLLLTTAVLFLLAANLVSRYALVYLPHAFHKPGRVPGSPG
jgi:Ni/Fe-hydrogenase subunit HybB-like protein